MAQTSVHLNPDDIATSRILSHEGDRFISLNIGDVTLHFSGFNEENFKQARQFAMSLLTALANEQLPAYQQLQLQPVVDLMDALRRALPEDSDIPF